MNDNFWDKAFGGKDMLRLSLGAYNFRTCKNKNSVTFSFDYGVGKRIRVKCSNTFNWYIIEWSDGISRQSTAVFGLRYVRDWVEKSTGLSLDPFTRG